MRILGIETSCDETAISLVEISRNLFEVKSNLISSQIKLHQRYGGIVPEAAARAHLENILPLLKRSNFSFDVLAVTKGPGLITSLLIGVEAAKILSYFFKKPLIGVNHLEGHIYSNWLNNEEIKFPLLCLIISGGHTELVFMEKHGHYKVLGQTLDDAAGECFDKTAKLLRLGYPGGPVIERAAKKGRNIFNLPRPMLQSRDFNFSFSGLKTAVLYLTKEMIKIDNQKKADLAFALEQAVIDVLLHKTMKAARKYKIKSLLLAGGVSANKSLREQFRKAVKKEFPNLSFFLPPLKYCTDNAAMIAVAGYYHARVKDYSSWLKIKADPNLELKSYD